MHVTQSEDSIRLQFFDVEGTAYPETVVFVIPVGVVLKRCERTVRVVGACDGHRYVIPTAIVESYSVPAFGGFGPVVLADAISTQCFHIIGVECLTIVEQSGLILTDATLGAHSVLKLVWGDGVG